MDYTIRLVKKSDLTELAKMYVDVYNNFDVGEKWNVNSAKKLLKFYFEYQPNLCFVAYTGQELVGAFLTKIKPWWNGNHIDSGEIFVKFKYQKIGVGTQLIKKVFETAVQEYDAKEFEALTFANNYQLKWYKKIGITKDDSLVFITGDVKKVINKIK